MSRVPVLAVGCLPLLWGCYVIGDDDVDAVVNTIRGSEYRDRIRSISASQLLTLLEIQEDSGLQHKQILNLLLPLDTINVGSLVGLVQDVIEFREPQPEGGQGQERAPEGWTPDAGANAVVGEISRHELPGAADAKVAIFPSREDGIPFLEVFFFLFMCSFAAERVHTETSGTDQGASTSEVRSSSALPV